MIKMAHCIFGTQVLRISVAVWTLFWAAQVAGDCNTCSAITGMACVSDVKFAACVDGRPTIQTSYTCPNGTVCSTVGNVICQPNIPDTVKACQDCGVCDSTLSFACTSTTSFALCLGSSELSPYTGSCAPDSVCSINYPYICGNINDPTSGVSPTCSVFDDEPASSTTASTTTVATTVTPITPSASNPTPFCQIIKQSGRFPVGSDQGTTCKQYVYCFLYRSNWRGATYECPGQTYFNSSSQLCGSSIPARCGNTVQSIFLLNFELN